MLRDRMARPIRERFPPPWTVERFEGGNRYSVAWVRWIGVPWSNKLNWKEAWAIALAIVRLRCISD